MATTIKGSLPKKPPSNRWLKPVILGAVLVLLVGVGVAAAPLVMDWLTAAPRDRDTAEDAPPSAQLIRDAQGRPGLRLSAEVVKSLRIETKPARPVTREAPLPALLGQTNYSIDHLYPVRSIGNGKVIAIENNLDASESSLPGLRKRPLGFGDVVKKGQLLAVVRSPDLAEKKGAYVDSLLDLSVDKTRLAAMERAYRKGAIAEATYRDAVAKVQKDILAMERARRILVLTRLKPQEIKDLEKEAETIKKRFRELARPDAPDRTRMWSSEQVDKWARVEVRAPESGTIVEKNTNVGDITDPGKDPPMFRLANLHVLDVWITPLEEYLPVLQKLLKEQPRKEIRLVLKLQSDPTSSRIKGRLLRFAPSIDPNQRTPLLIGRVENPDKRLLVGQLLMASIFVPQESGLVEIPTNALNDVYGQSLVFVRSRGFFGTDRYTLRRVQVAHYFADRVQVRSVLHLSKEDQERVAKEVKRGLRPIEPLKPGEEVVTAGVVEMTGALEDLQAKARDQGSGIR